MEARDSLTALQDLYQDLIAISTSQLPTIERLCLNLEAHVSDFKRLLDKPVKSEASRKSLSSGRKSASFEEFNFHHVTNLVICFRYHRSQRYQIHYQSGISRGGLAASGWS